MARAHADEDGLHAGRILGPYELLVPVGSGGMAHVWAARHRTTGSIFALKLLRTHLAENASFRQMFFDEARLASRIRHENVCATYELVDLDGVLAIIMEWVDGSSLVRVLRPDDDEEGDGPRIALPFRHAVKILSETCAGLHAAHDLVGDDGRSLGVVHRDVSPHNVLLTLDGRVKVTDFGVAKALGKLHMTIAGQVKGKLAYMSPEQLVGGGVDRRSDVFALGTVLYEVTTGRRPFEGEHDPQVMSAIVMGNCEPPSAVIANYPHELEAIVMCAMATEPDARYATAFELRQALEGWLARSGPPLGPHHIASLLRERCGRELFARAEALSLPPPPPLQRPSRAPPVAASDGPAGAARRKSLGFLGGAFAVLLGIALGIGALMYLREARRAHGARAATHASRADTAPGHTVDAGVLSPGIVNGGEVDEAAAAAPPVAPVAIVLPAASSSQKEVKVPSPDPPPRKKRPAPAPPQSAGSSAAAPAMPPNPYE